MATFVLKDAFFSVNAVDLSDHVREITIETTTPEVDATTMGMDFISSLRGIADVTITVGVLQDFAAGEVDATLWPLSTTDTPFVVAIRPQNAAISTTNPEFQMTSLMFGYSPIAGGIGDAASTDLVFRNASQVGLVRDTTP